MRSLGIFSYQASRFAETNAWRKPVIDDCIWFDSTLVEFFRSIGFVRSDLKEIGKRVSTYLRHCKGLPISLRTISSSQPLHPSAVSFGSEPRMSSIAFVYSSCLLDRWALAGASPIVDYSNLGVFPSLDQPAANAHHTRYPRVIFPINLDQTSPEPDP